MRVSVIGIGSNSVRMLLADVTDGKLERILRDREGTRLFAGLDENNCLSEESMRRTAGAAALMVGKARAEGAEQVHIFATSASRDAANGEDFIQLVRTLTGEDLDIISGEEEACLSFLGATDGVRVPCGVIDIGGGSTEVVTGLGAHVGTAVSCQMGAVRLYNMLPLQSSADLKAVIAKADEILTDTLAGRSLDPLPERWIGTGGTFTTLAAMVKGIRWTDRTYMHGTTLAKEKIEVLAIHLADMPMEERLKLPGLQPNRADIVVHGICILLAIMEHFGMTEITVSELGNLDGFIRNRYL